MPAVIPATPANPLEKYRIAVDANPQSAEAHSDLGWGYYGQKQYAEAVNEYKEALRLDPNLLDAHWGLALTLKESGSKVEAIAAFEKAVGLASKVENKARGHMLIRLAHGHINQLNKGDWDLDKELRHREE